MPPGAPAEAAGTTRRWYTLGPGSPGRRMSLILEHLTRGSFNFFRPSAAELRRVFPTFEEVLPAPQTVFQAGEGSTPLVGYPLQRSRLLTTFEETFDAYVDAEEEAQLAVHGRRAFDSRALAAKWERYRAALAQMSENAIASSHGRGLAETFWLYHSSQIARRLKEIPKRLVRQDLAIGRDHGDAIKYKLLFKLIDRVVDLTSDIAQNLANEIEGVEESLFPPLLGAMRDNVLIFSEDHVSPDLSELSSYFAGCLHVDGRDLRQRLAAVQEWHARQIGRDPALRAAATHLLGLDPDSDGGRRLFDVPGYLAFLSRQPGYDGSRFPAPEQVQVWDGLLVKLKEFEVLHALRKLCLPVSADEDGWVARERDRNLNTTWVGRTPTVRLSPATRPIDFTVPGVIDPLVHRFGMVYDITDFSAILSLLGRAEKSALDDAFRKTFRLQRRINKLAASLRLRLEKYLGDGAFYSGRHARAMAVVAVYAQRSYREVLEQGFPFNRGVRVAVNYGEYRLMPLAGGYEDSGSRYEYFGHGLVELSRLSTGKTTQEVDELKTYLVAQGYPETAVNKFFAPLLQRSSQLKSKQEESRPFFAYINPNGTLINEGIVATEPFIARLGDFETMAFRREGGRGYIAVELAEEAGGRLRIGLRKLGVGKFKGLDPTPVYEIVDGVGWDDTDLKPLPPQDLLTTLERLFASSVTRASGSRVAADSRAG